MISDRAEKGLEMLGDDIGKWYKTKPKSTKFGFLGILETVATIIICLVMIKVGLYLLGL